jgi:hypothetical protein
MLSSLLGSLAILGLSGVAGTQAAQGNAYLEPDLRIGEQLVHVFSKAVSIQGTGFEEYVRRVSGTGQGTVRSIDAHGIAFDATYRYDGHPAATAVEKRLGDGVTDCWDGQCAVNDSTSGRLFNRSLWGKAPDDLRVGMTWTARLDRWEIGPAGTETVSVVQIDPRNREVTLVRTGRGAGPSDDDDRAERIRITVADGQPLEVKVVPGTTTWRGRTIVRRGVIVSDVIMVARHVTLISASGRTFEGEQRSYTLENLLQDQR